MDTYLVIDPDECIDCGACVPECPVEAIFADTDVPDEEEEWIERNETEAADAPIAEGDSPCLLYTSPSPRDTDKSRMPSSA